MEKEKTGDTKYSRVEKRLLVNSEGAYYYTPLQLNELFYRQNVYSTKNLFLYLLIFSYMLYAKRSTIINLFSLLESSASQVGLLNFLIAL